MPALPEFAVLLHLLYIIVFPREAFLIEVLLNLHRNNNVV